MDPKQKNSVENEELLVPEVTETPVEVKEEKQKEEPRTDFQKKVASWSEKKWKWISGICGAILGFAVIFFLYGGNEDEGFSMFSLYAVVLALFVPKTLESTCGRSVRFGQLIMIIAMTIGLLVQLIMVGMKTGFSLT